MKDGSICMIFEPYLLEDIVCLSDPVSADTVSVLKITALDGKILALYVHYATHPAIACGLDFLVSRDFPGWMTDSLKACYGDDLVVLYANGAEGNMAVPSPEEGFHNTFEECARVGTQLAQTVMDIVPNTMPLADTTLKTARTTIQVPVTHDYLYYTPWQKHGPHTDNGKNIKKSDKHRYNRCVIYPKYPQAYKHDEIGY